jgi:Ca2+-binding EF-hand superfamily protein
MSRGEFYDENIINSQGNGYINVSDLREILRALDDKITDDELDEMWEI